MSFDIIFLCAPLKPEENGYAERLMRTIKEEEVDLSEYSNFAVAHRQIGRFIDDVYMTKRIHSALGYLTPLEFETAWRITQREPTTPLRIAKNLSRFLGPLHSLFKNSLDKIVGIDKNSNNKYTYIRRLGISEAF